jgi:PTS system trehalose-specific IIC component
MRFVLNDPSKADIPSIKELDSVNGSFTQAGQFQVVIGPNVKDFYNEFVSVSGIEGVSKDELKSAAKQNQNIAQRVVGVLAEIFSPLIPAIIIGGLLLGFRNVLESIPMMQTAAGKVALVEYSQFWKGIDHFLWLICEGIFHFLPVGITWSVTKKMGCTEILGIVLGLSLVSPQLLNAYAVAGTPPENIPVWNFGFTTVRMIGYQAQVIPAMLAALLFCHLERFFRRVIPQAVSMIFVPLFSLVPAVFLAHTVLGPFGWWLGSGISNFIYSGLTGPLNWLLAVTFGFLYAPLVITGLHHMTNAIDFQLMADMGGTILWPMIAL